MGQSGLALLFIMIYIKAETGYWIKYDTDKKTCQVINVAEVLKEKKFIEEQLASLPAYPDDAELLAWAKANYTLHEDTEKSRTQLQERLDTINAEIAAATA